MVLSFLRWLGRNLGTLLLAFILAVVVWVSAVTTADPNEELTYRPVTLELVGQDPALLLTSDVPNQVRLTLKAPHSIWNQLNSNPTLVQTWLDLSGLSAGDHTVLVKVQINTTPVRTMRVDPQEVHVTLEPLVSQSFPVQVAISGDVPIGYRMGPSQHSPADVTVSGPESQVKKVAQVQATLKVDGANETVRATVPVEAVDEEGNVLSGLTIVPRNITATQPVNLLGGFKNVVVKVVTTGQVSSGYRLTNISVSPPNVTVFSTNPALVDDLPGYVETTQIDLSNLHDDLDVRTSLNLPRGVSLVGEQSVLVQIGVAAVESSSNFSVPVEMVGLSPDLRAVVSPAEVDVLVYGPLPVLDTLTNSSFRVIVNVSNLTPGSYQLVPVIDLAPDRVRVQSVSPSTVSVDINLAPSPTPTVTITPTRVPTMITPTPKN